MNEIKLTHPFEQSSQESLERKRKSFEIRKGENTYAFEAESYDFEYPKNIQDETGIIGYERMIVSKENLFELAKEWSVKEQGVSLEELGVDSWEALYEYEEKSDWDSEDWKKVKRCIDDITLFQLDSLSNDEYPTYCYNHKLGAFAASETHAAYLDTFKKDKFFLQKIYDIDNVQKEVERTGKAYTNIPASRDVQSHVNFVLYDTETKQPISGATHTPIKKIIDYKDKIKNGEIYAIQTRSGLNFTPSFFFQGVYGMKDTVAFGFPFNADSFMEEYLDKILKEIIGSNNYDKYLAADVVAKMLINDAFKNDYWKQFREDQESGDFKDFLKERIDLLLRRMNLDIEPRVYDELVFTIQGTASFFVDCMDKIDRHAADEVVVTNLPIFIGHQEIPQLSWGHAKYANYYNEKGLNFFTFKHADHLPVRHNKEQDLDTSQTLEK